MKECAKCNAVKDADEFWPDKACSTGLASYCKTCSRIAAKASKERLKRTPEGRHRCNGCRVIFDCRPCDHWDTVDPVFCSECVGRESFSAAQRETMEA